MEAIKMKLPNSVPSQVNVRIVEIEYTLQLEITCFQILRERTNHSENEQIYHPNFVWYIGMSSSGDINQMPYHLTAFEPTNQLLYVNFPSLRRKSFQKDQKSTLPPSIAL